MEDNKLSSWETKNVSHCKIIIIYNWGLKVSKKRLISSHRRDVFDDDDIHYVSMNGSRLKIIHYKRNVINNYITILIINITRFRRLFDYKYIINNKQSTIVRVKKQKKKKLREIIRSFDILIFICILCCYHYYYHYFYNITFVEHDYTLYM